MTLRVRITPAPKVNLTKWRPEYVDQVFRLALLFGATEEGLARYFEVDISTINSWKHKYPEFRDALQRGRDDTDSRVAKSLCDQALGYDYEEEVIVMVAGRPVKETVRKHRHGNPWAARQWLAARQKFLWSENKTVDINNMQTHRLEFDLSGVSTEDLLLLKRILPPNALNP
jgi:hypothetical protein